MSDVDRYSRRKYTSCGRSRCFDFWGGRPDSWRFHADKECKTYTHRIERKDAKRALRADPESEPKRAAF